MDSDLFLLGRSTSGKDAAHEADFVQLGLNLAGSDDIRRLLATE